MKAVAEFDVDFAGIVPVEAAEGLAVVEIDAAIGHVQRVQRRGEALPEILADREIESCVLRQVVSGIWVPRKSIAETRAVVDVGGSK